MRPAKIISSTSNGKYKSSALPHWFTSFLWDSHSGVWTPQQRRHDAGVFIRGRFYRSHREKDLAARAASGPFPPATGVTSTGPFSEEALTTAAAKIVSPDTTADLAWLESFVTEVPGTLDILDRLACLPTYMISVVERFVGLFDLSTVTVSTYKKLNTRDVRESGTVSAITVPLGFDLSQEKQFKQLMAADVPGDGKVDLANGKEKAVDSKIQSTRPLAMPGGASTLPPVRVLQLALPWVAKEVISTETIVGVIPRPSRAISEAMAETNITELVESTTDLGLRTLQFIYIVLLIRFPSAIPSAHIVAFNVESSIWAKAFRPFFLNFVTQDTEPSRYMRGLFTYLRSNASSSDKFDFGLSAPEKRACLLLGGIKTRITQRASLLTSTNRLSFGKAKLLAVARAEADEIAVLERDFPCYRISNIIWADLPNSVATLALDAIAVGDRNAGVRSRALALRTWKATEYINLVLKASEAGFDSSDFELLCEKPLKKPGI
jgi:hypothetical protein